MEYRSPLGYNFKLNDSLLKEAEKQNESKTQSGMQYAPPKIEVRNTSFPFEQNRKRNSYFDDESPRGSNGKSKWNYSKQRNVVGNNIEDFFHPSMLEDPWKNLIDNKTES